MYTEKAVACAKITITWAVKDKRVESDTENLNMSNAQKNGKT